MYLGIALHLAMPEQKENRLMWVHRIYDMLSKLEVTMATPTLSNARKPNHQLSSCFIDTVPDSLDGIYRSLDNFSQVSKFGGGMGMYFGKVRATGGNIRGFKGVAGGVIRWMRLVNDTAVAVDQLGMRQGAVAVYLDVWHKDLPEFLQLRTNNGDDRMKAHDIFPAVCYPDLFWKMADENLDQNWYLFCPNEIMRIKGYCLEDCYGEEWERKYLDCVNDQRLTRRVISIKDIIRLVLRSAVETGTPFTFNRDTVNRANPNHHKGMIYCSNLCTEIAQNMAPIETVSKTIETKDGETIVVTLACYLDGARGNRRIAEHIHVDVASQIRNTQNEPLITVDFHAGGRGRIHTESLFIVGGLEFRVDRFDKFPLFGHLFSLCRADRNLLSARFPVECQFRRISLRNVVGLIVLLVARNHRNAGHHQHDREHKLENLLHVCVYSAKLPPVEIPSVSAKIEKQIDTLWSNRHFSSKNTYMW